MKKRKLLITGGMVTTLLLSSSPHSAKAAHIPVPTHSYDRDTKDTLIEQGFSPSQISKILKKR